MIDQEKSQTGLIKFTNKLDNVLAIIMPRDMIDQEKSHAGLIKITKKLEDVTTMKQSCEQVSFKS